MVHPILSDDISDRAAAQDAPRTGFWEPTLQAQFDEQGYVVVDLFNEPELAELISASQAGRPDWSPPNDPANSTYMSVYDGDHLLTANRVLRPRLDAAMQRYLVGYRALIGVFFIKEPETRQLPIHQHPPSLFDLTDVAICCWCAFGDIDEDNGPLRVVPRSHRLTRHVETARLRPYFADFADAAYEKYSIPVPIKAGQAVIFDNSLLHGSGPNRTSQRRMAVFSLLIPEGKTQVHIADEPGFEFQAIEIDEPFGAPEIYGGPLPERLKSRTIGRIDARQSFMTEAEFAELLRRNQRITDTFDPLHALRAEHGRMCETPDTDNATGIRKYLANASVRIRRLTAANNHKDTL